MLTRIICVKCSFEKKRKKFESFKLFIDSTNEIYTRNKIPCGMTLCEIRLIDSRNFRLEYILFIMNSKKKKYSYNSVFWTKD